MEVLHRIREFCRKEEGIRSLIQTGDRINPSLERNELMDYEFVIGVTDMEEFKDYRVIQKLFEDVLMLEQKDDFRIFNKRVGDNVSYNIILDDVTRIRLIFIKNMQMQDYINKDSLAKIISDKDDLLKGNTSQTDVGYRITKPTEEEFTDCCNEFFISSLNVAKGLYRGETIYAIQIYDRIRKNMDKMTAYYIGVEYDFKVNVGEHYEYIKNYLKTDHFDAYLETYPLPDREKLWSALFKTASLFRKEGLYVAEKLEYEYPKRADRDIVKKVRDIWNMYAQ